MTVREDDIWGGSIEAPICAGEIISKLAWVLPKLPAIGTGEIPEEIAGAIDALLEQLHPAMRYAGITNYLRDLEEEMREQFKNGEPL